MLHSGLSGNLLQLIYTLVLYYTWSNQSFHSTALELRKWPCGDPSAGNITKWVLLQTAKAAITPDRRWEPDKPSSWGKRTWLMESHFSGGLWLDREMGSTAPGGRDNLSEGEAARCLTTRQQRWGLIQRLFCWEVNYFLLNVLVSPDCFFFPAHPFTSEGNTSIASLMECSSCL